MIWLDALRNANLYPHPVTGFELIETHISWVLLTGPYAYKFKKPVDLGFLDFSSLDKRRHYCEEELRLNRRLAPELYLEVVALTGSPAQPVINGDGSPFEYGVKMVQFDQAAQLDRVLARGALQARHIDRLAEIIARFHASATVAPADSDFGSPEAVRQPVTENFRQIHAQLGARHTLSELDPVAHWSDARFAALREPMAARKRDGFVRECHGDMHLRNIALLDDDPVIFDCIEFNASLRWIDVMSEIAFLIMDLHDRRQHAFAWRFLNAYLEQTGDYAGLALLHYYLAYRAMVRAKVAAIRLGQSGARAAEHERALAECADYVRLAQGFTQPTRPALLITHGLSGSGKTTHSGPLLETLGAVRIRSDIERKRLHGLAARDRAQSAIDSGLYSAAASERTYERLAELAAEMVRAGFTVIVDAAFLSAARRSTFANLARELDVPYLILDFTAPDDVLRRRVQQRVAADRDASDADVSVLDHQLASREALNANERAHALRIDTTAAVDIAGMCALIRERQRA